MAEKQALDLLRPYLARRDDGFERSVASFIGAEGRALAWRAAEELDGLLESRDATRRARRLKHIEALQHDLWAALLREGRDAPAGPAGESGVREPRRPRPAAPAVGATLEVPAS